MADRVTCIQTEAELLAFINRPDVQQFLEDRLALAIEAEAKPRQNVVMVRVPTPQEDLP